jgi:hypothetical protein
VGILEKPFSLETLRRKLSNIQGERKQSGALPTDVAVRIATPADAVPKIIPPAEVGPKIAPPAKPAQVAEGTASKLLPSATIRRVDPEG